MTSISIKLLFFASAREAADGLTSTSIELTSEDGEDTKALRWVFDATKQMSVSRAGDSEVQVWWECVCSRSRTCFAARASWPGQPLASGQSSVDDSFPRVLAYGSTVPDWFSSFLRERYRLEIVNSCHFRIVIHTYYLTAANWSQNTNNDNRKKLANTYPKLAPIVLDEENLTLALNEQYVPMEEAWKLKEGDTVALIPPISGGWFWKKTCFIKSKEER